MKAQIKGYLGQMAHRRQIAQWAGTRTTHPGGTRFETRVRDRSLPKTRECVWPFPQGLFFGPKNTPLVFLAAKNCIFSLKPRSCRRQLPAAFFYAPKHTPLGFYIAKDRVFEGKTYGVRVPIPARTFYAPQNTPQGVSRGKSSAPRRRNPSLGHAPGSSGSTGSTE